MNYVKLLKKVVKNDLKLAIIGFIPFGPFNWIHLLDYSDFNSWIQCSQLDLDRSKRNDLHVAITISFELLHSKNLRSEVNEFRIRSSIEQFEIPKFIILA